MLNSTTPSSTLRQAESVAAGSAAPVLVIVIPALNEEQAIASIIERCLAAREVIKRETDVRAVEIVVVSDGSTDRTVEIAQGYSEVHLVVFPKNQGYGAAIQAGWQKQQGDLLAFLDADGTCDPLNFIQMCNSVTRNGYDVVLGSRMGADSQMPPIRRLGNRIYAWMLRVLSRKSVQDTASGMRVIRRDALPRLMPLPDGLHFTPAMSARALMDDIQITEVPMSYRERIGRSKLNVLRDGLRFLAVIVSTALYVRPSRITIPMAGGILLAVAAMMATPAWVYLQQHRVEEWMIYRFLLSSTLVLIAGMTLTFTHLAEQLIAVSRIDHAERMRKRNRWWTTIDNRIVSGAALVLLAAAVFLAFPALVSYLQTRTVSVHWSRIVTAMLFVLLAMQGGFMVLTNWIIRGVVRQQACWLAAWQPGPTSDHS